MDDPWHTALAHRFPTLSAQTRNHRHLARNPLEYARDEKLKVDVVCPLVADYIRKKPGVQRPGRKQRVLEAAPQCRKAYNSS
jgi:hypothetical protein